MNYQQTKTIKKYNVNKNLLLVGLLVFASFVQACGGGVKSSKGGGSSSNPALLALLGKWEGMTSQVFMSKVGQDAKECSTKTITIKLASGPIDTLKLPKEVEMIDEATSNTKNVPYFEALIGKLVKKGKLKGEQVEENEEITGVYKKVLDKFKEDNKDKNAKIFVIYQLLLLAEGGDIEKFKQEIAKVKYGACGVLVQIDTNGTVCFVDLTEADKKSSKKYVLSEELSKFIEDEVVKSIEGLKVAA